MKKRDLLWLLAYPLYQLVGTARHEAGHALVAWLQGYPIQAFVFWPTWGDTGIRWGCAAWVGSVSAVALFGPYVLDLLTFLIALFLCTQVRFRRHWFWLNMVILGMISPLVNSLYNYVGGFRGSNDVGRLLERWPGGFVHGYFLLTLSLYLIGVIWSLRHPQGWDVDLSPLP